MGGKVKTCKKCKEQKPEEDFHKNNKASDKMQSNCRVCQKEYCSHYRVDNAVRLSKVKSDKYKNLTAEQKRELKYLGRYGIGISKYNEMLENQNGVCAICANPPSGHKKRLCVDHCHETGTVRGLLCDACNVGLGRFKDDPELLVSAISYLEGVAK